MLQSSDSEFYNISEGAEDQYILPFWYKNIRYAFVWDDLAVFEGDYNIIKYLKVNSFLISMLKRKINKIWNREIFIKKIIIERPIKNLKI
jgi:hypothetical protein